FNKIEEVTDNDSLFKQECLGLIINELQLLEVDLNQVLNDRDSDSLNRILHKIKGTSSTAGLLELNKMVVHFENKIESHFEVWDEIPALFIEIEILLKLLIDIKE